MRRYITRPLLVITLATTVAWGQSGVAAAESVMCGSVLTIDTTLAADLDCREAGAAYALTLGAPGITLDLGGHQVLTDWESSGGVLNDGHDDVTITDGRLAGGFHGVVLINGADDNVLTELTGSSESDVLSATAVSGLTVDGVSNAVTDNSFAVGLTDVTGAVVRNVTTNDGVRLTRTTDSTVTGNVIGGSDMGGVVLYDSDRNVVSDNAVRNNSGVNIYVDGTDNQVLRNSLQFAQWNIQVTGDADGTLVEDNVVDVANAGILVDAGTTGTVLDGNTATGGFPDTFFGTERYRGDGIHVASASTTLSDNTADGNQGWGIWAVAGVTDGGGNSAAGNTLGQCEGVDCGTVGPPECTIVGTDGDDVLTGTPGDDVICGLGGDDVLRGEGGHDTLLGGEGADTINGGDGDDELQGGPGADRLVAGNGFDRVDGDEGVDRVTYSEQVDVDLTRHRALSAESGDDEVYSIENVIGSPYDDTLRGSDRQNLLQGNGGADTIIGEGANDRLLGNAGHDDLTGGKGTDRCEGGGGRDRATACESTVHVP